MVDAVNVRADDGSPITTRNGVVQELDTAGLPANAAFYGASPMIKVQEGFWLFYLGPLVLEGLRNRLFLASRSMPMSLRPRDAPQARSRIGGPRAVFQMSG